MAGRYQSPVQLVSDTTGTRKQNPMKIKNKAKRIGHPHLEEKESLGELILTTLLFVGVLGIILITCILY